jgi:acetoin utilization deacetylase AcuC-like enzyme
MAILFATHERFLDHRPGRGHPESPARLRAVDLGVQRAGLAEALIPVTATEATDEDLGRIHPEPYRRALESFCAAGGSARPAGATSTATPSRSRSRGRPLASPPGRASR